MKLKNILIGTFVGSFIMIYVGLLLQIKFENIFSLWLFFAGSTSYALSNNNFKVSVLSNFMGANIGFIIILLGLISNNIIYNTTITAFFTMIIVLLGIKFNKIFNTSAIFIGGFSSFATYGNIKMVILSLLLGILFGVLTNIITEKINK